ncbi:immunoglobulin-like domain-containing protein [Breznakia pachnodae]|uniref:DUF5011 domain-containing protein n=1 Tax=Breznakia pachnodae TaxID=265178 RepID=A0ABU0E5I1_9FIRM|nr:immunoglobulin-like domain-containing protein [Breznakia pachnodae]MDQ0362154.1 hypothetical protein [Breznakia pachnodae]
MRLKLNALLKVTISLILSFTCIGALFNTTNLLANEEFEIKEEVTYNDEATEAVISFDIEGINDKYSIKDIIDPEGISLGITDVTYVAKENKTYTFNIIYAAEEDEYTYEKEVVVDGLNNKKETSLVNQTKGIVSPRISGSDTDGSSTITMDIPNFEPLTGWSNGDIKTITLTADFGADTTSSGKKVVFSLPDGMRYVQIPVTGEYNTTDVDTSVLSTLPSGGVADYISKVIIPTQDTLFGDEERDGTHGEVIYEFTPGTQKATIEIQVRVDAYKYYGPHLLADKLTTKAYIGSPETLIGTVEQEVNVVGPTEAAMTITTQTIANVGTPELLASTNNETVSGSTEGRQVNLSGFGGRGLGADRMYAKSGTLYAYYPEGMENAKIVLSAQYKANTSIVHQPEQSRFIVKYDNTMTFGRYYITYDVPVDMAEGTYTAPSEDYADYVWYNNSTSSSTTTTAKQSVTIVDPDSVENKMLVKIHKNIVMDNSSAVEPTYMYGPYFDLQNATAGMKTNQVFEMTSDAAWQIEKVYIPFDNTVSTNSLTSIEYQINGVNTWLTYTPASASDINYSKTLKRITKEKMGLGANDYITAIRADVGSYSSGYSTGYNVELYEGNFSTYGSLKVGATTANVTMKVYDKDNPTLFTEGTRTVSSLDSKASVTTLFMNEVSFTNLENEAVNQIIAGDSFIVNLKEIRTHFRSSDIGTMNAPEFYLRQPKNTLLNIDSLVITDQDENLISGWSHTSHVNSAGETIYTITMPPSTNIGYYFSQEKTKFINLSYEMSTTTKLEGVLNARNLAAWDKSGYVPGGFSNLQPFTDIHDFNNNGSITDKLFSFRPVELVVTKNQQLVVESYLTLGNEEPSDPYVEGNDNTIAYFMPGVDAKYSVDVTNNSPDVAESLDIYLPIPKTGEDFGSGFQDEEFKWDMALSNLVNTTSTKFDISYSTEATEANYDNSATYVSNPSTSVMKDIKMIKISLKTGQTISPAESVKFEIDLKVDENFESASDGDKIATRNIYNPRFYIKSTSATGFKPGAKVGAQLVIGQISGFVFNDKNADGLYRSADGDTLVGSQTVELYKYNESTSDYEFEGSTVTNTSGVYTFDTETNGLDYSTYAIKFADRSSDNYEFTIRNTANNTLDINSDVIQSGSDAGWIKDINATIPGSQYLSAGYIKYNPPVDLTLTLPSTQTVKVGGEVSIAPTKITPDFWDSIKQSYTWELVNAADSQYVTLSNDTTDTVTITGIKQLTNPSDTIQVKLTIKDVYGTTVSEIVEVKVITSSAPSITAPTVDKYVGDTIDLLDGVSATDNYGATITLATTGTDANTTINSSVPVSLGILTQAGTYNVVYTVTDAYGNVGTYTRLVKVNGLPQLTVYNQSYSIEDTGIANAVATAARANYDKASDSVGVAVEEDITSSVGYTVLSGPNGTLDFSETGIYSVKYSVSVGGKTKDKTVDVVVLPATIEVSGDLAISADNVVLTYAEVEALTKSSLMSKANTVAYEYTKENGNITKIEDITDSVNVKTNSEYDAVKDVTTDGGIFKVTLVAQGSTSTIETEIQVVVLGNTVEVEDGIVIKAKGFTVPNIDAEDLDLAAAISNSDASAFELANDATVTNISVNNAQLLAINTATLEGGSFPLTFTATKGSESASIEVTVVVSPTLIVPTVSAANQEYFVGDAFDVMSDVSAKDALNDPITLVTTGSGKNINITSTVPVGGDGKLTTAGTYTVTYAVSDKFDNVGSATRTVKVHGVPTITAYDQVYNINNSTIQATVDAAYSAEYEEALDGGATQMTTLTATATITSGPTGYSGFDKVGTYKVEYSTSVKGKTVKKVVNVVVTSDDTITDGDLSISASNFSLTQAQLSSLTTSKAKEYANAVAYEFEKENGNTVNTEDITDTITTVGLSDIKEAGSEGGIFTLTFKATGNSGVITKDVIVVVEGDNYVVENGIVITANDFVVANADAEHLDNADVIARSGAQAFYLESGNAVAITATASELDTIKAVGLDGEDGLPLTFTAEDSGNTATISVNVDVTHTLIPPTITANDCEHYVGDSFDVLHGVSAEDATNTNIPVLTTRATTNTTITHNIPVTDGKYTTPGTYEVTYEITDRFGNTQTKTRTVKVHGLPEVKVNGQLYLVGDQTIEAQVKAAVSASYLQAQDTVGAQPMSIDLTSDVSISVVSGPNGVTDFSIEGLYKVAYSVTNTDGKTTTATVDVLILEDTAIWDKDQKIAISAKGFALENADAKNLSEDIAKDVTHGNASAFYKEVAADGSITYLDITDEITVYEHELKAIQEAGKAGGIYNLTYIVKHDDKEVSHRVKVTVIGTTTPPTVTTPDGDELTISANDFTMEYKDALTIDESMAIELSEVEAYLLKNSTEDTLKRISINVNGNQLAEIRKVSKKGGVYELTFTALYTAENGDTVTNEVTVSVTVLEEGQRNPSTAPTSNNSVNNVNAGDTTNTTSLMILLVAMLGVILVLKKRTVKNSLTK